MPEQLASNNFFNDLSFKGSVILTKPEQPRHIFVLEAPIWWDLCWNQSPWTGLYLLSRYGRALPTLCSFLCTVDVLLTTADFSEVSWTLLGASLWLSECDTIRRNKAFEVGRRGVSQQLHWLCPHSLNFMVGWDDKKTRRTLRVGEKEIEVGTVGWPQCLGSLILPKK